jgi:transposase, IS5 family
LNQSNRLQQKDADARLVQKNGLNHYGYKNSISADAEHGFLRKYAVTPGNTHDSQMLPTLLGPTNDLVEIWADSA